MFQVAALSWFTRRPITIKACNCLARSNFFTTCEVPVWEPVCYTQSMSLKSFDYSLFTNLSSRQLFHGMLHGYEFILSRIISRTILRHTPCTCNDILIVSKSIGEKIAFEERLKSYGLRFTFVSFQVLIPPAPIGGRKERGGGGKGKKRVTFGRRLPKNGGQKTVRQL